MRRILTKMRILILMMISTLMISEERQNRFAV